MREPKGNQGRACQSWEAGELLCGSAVSELRRDMRVAKLRPVECCASGGPPRCGPAKVTTQTLTHLCRRNPTLSG